MQHNQYGPPYLPYLPTFGAYAGGLPQQGGMIQGYVHPSGVEMQQPSRYATHQPLPHPPLRSYVPHDGSNQPMLPPPSQWFPPPPIGSYIPLHGNYQQMPPAASQYPPPPAEPPPRWNYPPPPLGWHSANTQPLVPYLQNPAGPPPAPTSDPAPAPQQIQNLHTTGLEQPVLPPPAPQQIQNLRTTGVEQPALAPPEAKMKEDSSGPSRKMNDENWAAPRSVAAEEPTVEWDYWPDGDFERDFTTAELAQTDNLMEWWANQNNGGDRKGSFAATTWQEGKKSIRKCLGIIQCQRSDSATEEVCPMVVRPMTTIDARARQLQQLCICNRPLVHVKCTALATLYKWEDGIHYVHTGMHLHARPTHILHISKDQRAEFQELVVNNPGLGPRALLTGARTKPVDRISSVFLNRDRTRYERNKVLGKIGNQGSGSFFSDWPEFCAERGDLQVHVAMDKIVTISVHTLWMDQQLIPDVNETYDFPDDPVNGFVTDATHRYWTGYENRFISTSVFCRHLKCWVPVMCTYANGETAQHYRNHFLALMEAIAVRAKQLGLEVTDRMFAGIADFSQAETNGFQQAFVAFWEKQPTDSRNRAELTEDAEKLLKGCQRHYRNFVDRVSRISGVVPPRQRAIFVARATALLLAESPGVLDERVKELLDMFPHSAKFFKWWLRKPIVVRLFKNASEMDRDLWESMPRTSNAGEAMHDTFYTSCDCQGRHEIVTGFEHLYQVLDVFRRRSIAVSTGQPERYGAGQRSKRVSRLTGRTRRQLAVSRKRRTAARYVNDGRPPDKASQLLPVSERKLTAKMRLKRLMMIELKKKAAEHAKGKSPTKRKSEGIPPPVSPTKRKSEGKPLATSPTKVKRLPKGPKAPSKGPKSPNKRRVKPVLGAPSYKWDNNSCWLDTSIQVLYMVFNRRWSVFEGLITRISSVHPFQELWKALDGRKNLQFTSVGEYEMLQNMHDKFRNFVVKEHLLLQNSPAHSFQPAFFWLEKMVQRYRMVSKHPGDKPVENPAASEQDWEAHTLFESWHITLDHCRGIRRSDTPAHAKVKSHPSVRYMLQLYGDKGSEDYQTFKGDMQKWFRDLTNVSKKGSSSSCWYRLSSTGEKHCEGVCIRTEYCIALPAVLMIEGCSSGENGPFPWTCPEKLTSWKQTGTNPLVYDLVARVFTNDSHYVVQYIGSIPAEVGVFYYDGMRNGGRPVSCGAKSISGADQVLRKSGDLPRGYRTAHLVYLLQGDHSQLRAFHESQIDSSDREHHLSFSSKALTVRPAITLQDPAYERVPDKDRYWMSDPHSPSVSDYRKTRTFQPSSSPKKATRKTGPEYPSPSQVGSQVLLDPESHTDGRPPAADPLFFPPPSPEPEEELREELREEWGGIAREVSEIPDSEEDWGGIRWEPAEITGREDVPGDGDDGGENEEQDGEVKVTLKRKRDEEEEEGNEDGPLPSFPFTDEEMKRAQSPGNDSVASSFNVECRCGLQGDGNQMNLQSEDADVMIECGECGKWSHLACQRGLGGKAGSERGIEKYRFKCHSCSMPRAPWKKVKVRPPSELIPGIGALARNGTFWYPVRLIRRLQAEWEVIWWRGCQFDADAMNGVPGGKARVNVKDVVKGHEAKGRDMKRLGKWELAGRLKNDEEVLFDPSTVPYDEETDCALRPDIEVLQNLIFSPDRVESSAVPALEWQRSQPSNTSRPWENAVIFVGGLKTVDLARINNWLDTQISNAGTAENRAKWGGTGTLPLAHARTLLLAYRKAKEIESDAKFPVSSDEGTQRDFRLRYAWKEQTEYRVHSVDVEEEAVAQLEEYMFAETRRRGYKKWGTAVGGNQDNWDPYNAA